VSTGNGRPSPLVSALLVLVLLELFLLGSGRLVQLGPLTLRMWLYLISLGYAVLVVLLRGALDREVVLLVLGFLALTVTSSLAGLLNHAPLEQVADDIKPLLFFLSILFFHVTITDLRQVRRVAGVVQVASLVLAAAYIAGIALVYLGVIPFGLVYDVLSHSDEFFFRGETGVFYKGFLYLGVGFCFFLVGRGWSKLLSVFLLGMIVLTFTRGLLLAAIVILMVAPLLRRGGALRWPLYTGSLVVGLAIGAPWLARAFQDRSASDAVRLLDVGTVEQSATWLSLLVGHGLGVAVGERTRIEESYLEILHQQGLLGLLFWSSVLALLARDYWRASLRGRQATALPFLLGALYVFLESVTNPFLTNPIGMSMVLVSLVVLKRLASMPSEALERGPVPVIESAGGG
jgi:hypothetical protein